MVRYSRRILFLSYKNQYLEHDLYCSIVKGFPADVKTVYLYSDYASRDTEMNLGFKKDIFNELIINPCPDFVVSLRTINGVIQWFKYLLKLLDWKKRVLSEIDRIQPSCVVTLSPFTVNALTITKHRKHIKTIFLQSCNTKRSYPKNIKLLKRLSIIFFREFVGVPIQSTQKNPLAAKNVDLFLMWSSKWLSVKKQLDKIRFTGFPLLDADFKQYEDCKTVPFNGRVLILLNKEHSMGLDNWLIYRDFYIQFMEMFSSLKIIFKPHPLSNIEMVKKHYPENLLVDNFDWDDVDLMINHWSSATVTSIVRGIPTILVNPEGRFNLEERFLDHYEATATNLNELKKIVDDFSDPSNNKFGQIRESYLKESFSGSQGLSTKTVIDILVQF